MLSVGGINKSNIQRRSMKYKLYRKDFQMCKNDFYILPSIRLFIDNHMYIDKNFSVEFHFIVFHIRLLFMNEK